MSPFWIYILANLGLFSLIRFVTSFSHSWQYKYFKKISYPKQCSGVVVAHVLWLMVWFHGKILFLVLWKVWTHTAYEFIYDEFSMNSFIFCTLNKWIHTNMNSNHVWIHILFAVIMYEFIHFLQYEFILCMNSYTFCSYHVWIHIFFAVQNKSCEHARAARAKPELTSCPDQAAPGCPDR